MSSTLIGALFLSIDKRPSLPLKSLRMSLISLAPGSSSLQPTVLEGSGESKSVMPDNAGSLCTVASFLVIPLSRDETLQSRRLPSILIFVVSFAGLCSSGEESKSVIPEN
uniref:Uncharacterized protein n=1 Tax=Rhizophora mucronata TaxID=61149 RepID=A0A2P2IXC3_RHIMU